MPEMVSTDPRPKFYGIDVVRGVATCMVALAHVAYRTGDDRWGGHYAFAGILNGLFIFVDFFFVLSGFLICWVHWKDIGTPGRLVNYVQRRSSRIYPIYWLVLSLYILGQFIVPSQTHDVPLDPLSLIGSYSLVFGIGGNLLGVAWTLYFEIAGYVFFGIMICLDRRIAFALLGAWATAIAVHYIATPIETSAAGYSSGSPIFFLLHPYHLQFLMGILLAVYLRHARIPAPKIVGSLGIILFLSAVAARPDILFANNQLVMRVTMGLLACMTIGGLVDAERYQAFHIPDWMQRFGAASYCIYLTHTIVEPPVMKAGWILLRHLPSEIWIFIVAGVAIVVGYVFHRLIELPLTEGVKKIVMGRKNTKPAILTT